ncbi:MAG TPA: DNA-directed RNA polymerase subunit beta', partial [Firmicutes bacterium]|nr:DNA-directed RNA polymerase subunit beta' [Bacillota bacterium]
QIRQLAGMRGLMADPSGRIIDLPIKANFREGLTVLEYFISTHGARKGLADTALRTADSGYLTRRLVDVAQDVIIREDDCDVAVVNFVRERARLLGSAELAIDALRDQLYGRVLAEDTVNPGTGEVILAANTQLDDWAFDTLIANSVQQITLYGDTDIMEEDVAEMAGFDVFSLGDARETVNKSLHAALRRMVVGRTLVEKVANPLTGELLFDVGQVLSEDNLETAITYHVREMKVRENNIKGITVEAIMEGSGVIESLKDRLVGRITADAVFHPETGEQLLAANEDIDEDTAEALEKAGVKSVSIRSVLTCKSKYGVCRRCYGRNLATGRLVDVGEAVGIIAAQSIGEPGTQLTMRTFHTGGVAGDDITQGLPRVEELFEARKPKRQAVITEIDGSVQIREVKGLRRVTVVPANGEERVYQIPYGSRLIVKEHDTVKAGDRLTEGSVNPHDILRVSGLQAAQRYLVHEVQKVYKSQGVEINDKHIEVMVRQMMHKVKVEEAGDTELLPGEYVSINMYEEENTKVIENGGDPAVARPVLLGITKASLATDSFLSAASFQETTRVLTEAAIKGKMDPLLGLKENVIIGKLVPAGTGMSRYSNIKLRKDVVETQI